MPNWCENELYISGPDVRRVLEAIKGENKDDVIDFDKIISMPDSLKLISGGGRDVAIALAQWRRGDDSGLKEILEWPFVKGNGIASLDDLPQGLLRLYGFTSTSFIEEGGDAKRPLTLEEVIQYGEVYLQNQEKYGAMDWYVWSIENWGTKWSACHSELEYERASEAVLGFDTAWSPPIPVVEALGRMFPDHAFHLEYREGGIGFQGSVVVEGKDCTQREDEYCAEEA